MRRVFADTGYWIAVLDPKDELHHRAKEVSRNLGHAKLITTEMVLAELLNYFADRPDRKEVITAAVHAVLQDANTEVVPQTSLQFRDAFSRYKSRKDKAWSLTELRFFSCDGTESDSRGFGARSSLRASWLSGFVAP